MGVRPARAIYFHNKAMVEAGSNANSSGQTAEIVFELTLNTAPKRRRPYN